MLIVMDAQDVTLRLLGPGEHEEGTVPDGKVALIVQSQTDMLAVIGTAQQLRGRVYDGLSLPVPDDVPLVDAE